MPPRPVNQFLTHVGTLLSALLTRVTTLGGPNAGDPAPRLGEPLTTLLRARLTQLAAAIQHILTAPPPKPRKPRAPTPPKLDFVPAVVSEDVSYPEGTPAEDPEPPPPPPEKPVRLPTHYRWLTKLFPEFLPDRHALEDQLREQDVKDAIAADPRLARAIRKLAWMLGVQRNLIPPAPRRRLRLLVVGCSVAQAKAQYANGLKTMTHEEIMAEWVMFPDHPFQQRMREVSRDKRHNHDKRPVWLGPYLKPPELLPIPYSFRG
jgi:hypothetical protein